MPVRRSRPPAFMGSRMIVTPHRSLAASHSRAVTVRTQAAGARDDLGASASHPSLRGTEESTVVRAASRNVQILYDLAKKKKEPEPEPETESEEEESGSEYETVTESEEEEEVVVPATKGTKAQKSQVATASKAKATSSAPSPTPSTVSRSSATSVGRTSIPPPSPASSPFSNPIIYAVGAAVVAGGLYFYHQQNGGFKFVLPGSSGGSADGQDPEVCALPYPRASMCVRTPSHQRTRLFFPQAGIKKGDDTWRREARNRLEGIMRELQSSSSCNLTVRRMPARPTRPPLATFAASRGRDIAAGDLNIIIPAGGFSLPPLVTRLGSTLCPLPFARPTSVR